MRRWMKSISRAPLLSHSKSINYLIGKTSNNLGFLNKYTKFLTPSGTTIELPSVTSIRLNVLGFLSRNNNLESFVFTGTITSDIVIECFNLFANSLQRKTIVVLDNAPIHTSDEFDERIDFWEEKGLFLYYLPPYCPELNLIEILWQRIKYFWLPFSAYLSFAHLSSCLEEILVNFGSKYQITFT